MSVIAWFQTPTFSNKSILSGMTVRIVALVVGVLLLVGSCLSQEKGRVHQTVSVLRVQNIFSSERRSGSLEFWGLCDIFPPVIKVRPVSGRNDSALEVLQGMFSDDPKMRVIQERDGKIRMVETDVPQDLLEVKIHHLSFSALYRKPWYDPRQSESKAILWVVTGPWAVYAILNTPEVIAFMDQNIGRQVAWMGWGMPRQIARLGPSVPGELNDVTVKQALDYVLQTVPGFWYYENCHDPIGRRMISVGFIPNLPPVSDSSLPKPK